MIEGIDHINVRTNQMDEMIVWYRKVLGFETGFRPAFAFPGAWLYAKDRAMVHLVSVETRPRDAGGDLQLEHVAFQANGLKRFIDRLEMLAEPYRLGRVDEAKTVQVNVWDPDGNHLHIDFSSEEESD